MKCPNPALTILSLIFLIAVALFSSGAQAQRVLESGGVAFRGPSLIEVRSTSRDFEVQEVLSRAEGSGGNGRYQVHLSAVETTHVCGTPCRFELTRPMELQVAGRPLHVVPDGAAQRYLIEPANRAGMALGILGVSFGAASVVTGALLLGLEPLRIVEDNNLATYGPIALGVGGALLLLGLVAIITSRGRLRRVDRFEF